MNGSSVDPCDRFGSADTTVQIDSEWIISLMRRDTFFRSKQAGGRKTLIKARSLGTNRSCCWSEVKLNLSQAVKQSAKHPEHQFNWYTMMRVGWLTIVSFWPMASTYTVCRCSFLAIKSDRIHCATSPSPCCTSCKRTCVTCMRKKICETSPSFNQPLQAPKSVLFHFIGFLSLAVFHLSHRERILSNGHEKTPLINQSHCWEKHFHCNR